MNYENGEVQKTGSHFKKDRKINAALMTTEKALAIAAEMSNDRDLALSPYLKIPNMYKGELSKQNHTSVSKQK